MKVEVWYCKTEKDYSDLMVEFEKERPAITWESGEKISEDFPIVFPAWVLVRDNKMSEYDDLGETATEELSTKFLVNHPFYRANVSDIHYHTTKPVS